VKFEFHINSSAKSQRRRAPGESSANRPELSTPGKAAYLRELADGPDHPRLCPAREVEKRLTPIFLLRNGNSYFLYKPLC
jgi:hypothetical protein